MLQATKEEERKRFILVELTCRYDIVTFKDKKAHRHNKQSTTSSLTDYYEVVQQPTRETLLHIATTTMTQPRGSIDLLSGDVPTQQQQQQATRADVENGSSTRKGGISNSPYVAMEIAGVHKFGSNVADQFENSDDAEEERSIDMSSVLTADGIHDVPGFCVVCLVILIGDMSRGAMFPSMWPLVEKLGGDYVSLGYCVAAFSFGRILVNPVFGSWTHTWGYTNTLLLSTCLLLFGTFCYTQVLNVGRVEFLIVAQTVLGIGSGTLGVTRAFVADVTAKRSRTTYMAWITAVQYGGFTVTPFVGALFNKTLGEDTDYKWG